MRVLQEFLICFIREFRFVFPVMATLLCMCLFIYFKSDVRRMQEKSSKIILFLLGLMLEIVLISAVLSTVAIRTRHLPVRVMADVWFCCGVEFYMPFTDRFEKNT